ncbi:formylglycine-generating enzyme family protein [Acaryochloris marina]|uniref:formylglycine-generating enzyme family protein n=1 Tax=Acaryochloris marina TaxID=155978 RepID=UPI0011D06FAE|nr:SUMF1/EgtB/PvdO family nonheme iron enzyme [Acaryochloris marina]
MLILGNCDNGYLLTLCLQGSRDGLDTTVLRGGSWNNNPRNCRSATRNRNKPDNQNNNVGFRVVCVSASTLRTRTE